MSIWRDKPGSTSTSPKISAFPVRCSELLAWSGKFKKRCDFGWVCSILTIEGPDSGPVCTYNDSIICYLASKMPICCSPRQNFTLRTTISFPLDIWCAWSDRYYVRNVGHEVSEFARDPDYYRQNYECKPWLGVEGWRKRLDATRSRPHSLRRSLVFPTATLQPEKTPGEIAGKSAQLWSMFHGNTAETEVLDFLYTLVRLVKPKHAVETGTWLGRSAVAIASAPRDNGFGHLISLD
jgi:hypothetical protein